MKIAVINEVGEYILVSKKSMFNNCHLVANTLKTSIRIIKTENNQKPDWDTIKSVFPIGAKMNEKTHMFDYSLFTAPSPSTLACFFLAAIPLETVNTITNTGISLFKSPYKLQGLETIEHKLFRHYILQNKNDKSFMIILPQGAGFRILHIVNRLPVSGKIISNSPDYIQVQLLQILNELKENPEIIPQNVLVLKTFNETTQGLNIVFDFFKNNGIKATEEILDLKDILLNS